VCSVVRSGIDCSRYERLPPSLPRRVLLYVPTPAPEHRQSSTHGEENRRKKKNCTSEKKTVPFVHKPVGVRVGINWKYGYRHRGSHRRYAGSVVDLGCLYCGQIEVTVQYRPSAGARSRDRLQRECKKISRRRKTALIQAPMWQPPPSFTVFPASCHKLTRHRSPDVDFPMPPEFLFCHFWISDSNFFWGG